MPKLKAKTNANMNGKPKATVRKTGGTKKSEATASTPFGSLARTAGTALGGFLGGPVGAGLGREAGAFVSHLLGQGDYTVEGNSLLTGNQVPTFGNDDKGLRIKHREFIADLIGSTSFANAGYNLNPGNNFLFPWLSTLATSFETYQFHGLVFEFKSTSANALNSTNTALGTVIMATSYDSEDADFISKRQAESYEFATSCRPADSMIHPIECKPGENVLQHLYLSTILEKADLPADSDPRFYYLGRTQFMTVGMQAAATIGELWVSYDVSLYKPRLPNPLGIDAVNGHFASTSNFNTGTIFSTVVRRLGSNVYATPSAGGNTISFYRPGRYLVAIKSSMSGTTFTGTYTYADTYTRLSWPLLDIDSVGNPIRRLGYAARNGAIPESLVTAIVDVEELGAGQSATWVVPIPGLVAVAGAATTDTYIVQLSSALSAREPTHGQMKSAMRMLASGNYGTAACTSALTAYGVEMDKILSRPLVTDDSSSSSSTSDESAKQAPDYVKVSQPDILPVSVPATSFSSSAAARVVPGCPKWL
jgi:hypothetical protein